MTTASRRGDMETLGRLVRSAEYQGASIGTLEAIIARAADEGAMRALARCGLHDDRAGSDIRELRALLDAWRDTKRTAWRTVVRWAIRGILALVLLGVALKLKLMQ